MPAVASSVKLLLGGSETRQVTPAELHGWASTVTGAATAIPGPGGQTLTHTKYRTHRRRRLHAHAHSEFGPSGCHIG